MSNGFPRGAPRLQYPTLVRGLGIRNSSCSQSRGVFSTRRRRNPGGLRPVNNGLKTNTFLTGRLSKTQPKPGTVRVPTLSRGVTWVCPRPARPKDEPSIRAGPTSTAKCNQRLHESQCHLTSLFRSAVISSYTWGIVLSVTASATKVLLQYGTEIGYKTQRELVLLWFRDQVHVFDTIFYPQGTPKELAPTPTVACLWNSMSM